MIQGQCLCGAITYEYQDELEQVIVCFCQDCQQAQGSMFAWNSPIDARKFRLCSGAAFLVEYFHTEAKARVFCQRCGSPLYSYRQDLPNVLRLRLGTVKQGRIPQVTECIYRQYQAAELQIKVQSEHVD